jgi:hypothetical protein
MIADPKDKDMDAFVGVELFEPVGMGVGGGSTLPKLFGFPSDTFGIEIMKFIASSISKLRFPPVLPPSEI